MSAVWSAAPWAPQRGPRDLKRGLFSGFVVLGGGGWGCWFGFVVYFRARVSRARGRGRRGEGPKQTPLSAEPRMGLDPTTLS